MRQLRSAALRGLAVVAVSFAVCGPAGPAAARTVHAPTVLGPGATLASDDGRYRLVVQTDGNAVVLAGDRVVWHAGTSGAGNRLAVQEDGNLVMYGPGDRVRWATGTTGPSARLVMQNDGNLVLYSGSRALWHTGGDRESREGTRLLAGQTLTSGRSLRSGDGRFRLTMQGDGNLVAYGPSGVGWATYTSGADNRVVMQGDGNLVVYSAAGRPLWHSQTHGPTSAGRGSRLVLQDDANLVLYRGSDGAVWNRRLAYTSSTRALTTAEQTRMTGVSWRPGCPVPLSQLRRVDVTYWDFQGQPREGALVVRHDRAADVTGVFGRLYAARYPIHSVRPIDDFGGSDDASMAANNTSAFNCRRAVGSTSYSRHAHGVAIDINPVQNPYVRGRTVLPPAGAAYLDRGVAHPGVLRADGVAVREFRARGWTWGGNWNSLKDYQHFEK